jgi:ATP-dependent Zn protease
LLESFAFAHFVDRAKDKSTLKAKCRSIWNWYNDRGWTIPKRYDKTMEETMATRSEHLRNVKKEEARRNRANVINLITGLMADEYKKKSGSWHFAKIAGAVKLTSKTVAKIIKEYEKEYEKEQGEKMTDEQIEEELNKILNRCNELQKRNREVLEEMRKNLTNNYDTKNDKKNPQ